MKHQALNEHIRQEFGQYELSNDQLQKLSRLQSDKKLLLNRKALLWHITSVAACLFFVVAVLFNVVSNKNIIPEIADEAAMNHIKLKPLEIKTQHVSGLQDYFTELEFSPLVSSAFSVNPKGLLGGRYCSIQGSIAAQLRYQNDDGSLVTLYETVYSIEQFPGLPNVDKGEQPIETFARGLRVRIWVEKGLVMASVNE